MPGPPGQEHDRQVRAPRRARPVVAAVSVLGVCYLLLAGGLIASGLVVTHLLGQNVGHWDGQVNDWFVGRRSAMGNRVTGDFTLLADTFGIIGVAAVAALVSLIRHRVELVMLLMIGLLTEIAVFAPTTYIVARPRPDVPHLGSTPSTFSWPSGHVAATFVLYGGIALMVTFATRRMLPRVLAWSGAAVLTFCVAISRIYRGDHHPTDAMAGLVLGVGALCTAVLVVRAWEASVGSTTTHDAGPPLPAEEPPDPVKVA